MSRGGTGRKSVEALETRDKEIDDLLTQEEIFTDVARVTELSKEKETLQNQLESLYEEWETLSE